jgi:hypothetical protein
MIASHNENKPLQRKYKILSFIKEQIDEKPNQETFQVKEGELSGSDSLLKDWTLLRMACKEIVDESGENIKIEFRQGVPTDYTAVKSVVTYTEGSVWFYVANVKKFREYLNGVKNKVESLERKVNFIIDGKGYFYPEGTEDSKKHLLRGREQSERYQLMYALAGTTEYVLTANLASELKTTPLAIRKKVDEIRDIVFTKWDLPRDSIFESDSMSGYRAPNIIFKES